MLEVLKNQIAIGDETIGKDRRPYIIAEIACAHDGDYDRAKALIDAATNAKADAVQLQFFDLDEVVTPHHEVFDLLKTITFSPDQWTELFVYARTKDIHVWVCTYDLPSVELAIKLGADGIKLNSSDLSNPEVVERVAQSGIPFTLGTGASTLEEINNGLQLAVAHGAKEIVLMHGVQNFPTRTEDLNISRITLLKDVFGVPVGYHDHTDGDDPFAQMVDLIAVGLGADIIEKHLTIDRSAKGTDYQAALEPDEYAEFVARLHRAHIAYGSKELRPFSTSDLKYRKFQKKSVVTAHPLKAGSVIARSDVKFIRNTVPGLAPIDFRLVEGKKLKHDLDAFANILESDTE